LLPQAEAPSSLLLIAPQVLRLLQADSDGSLRVVSTGVRVFLRSVCKGVACHYRVCYDALPFLLPRMSKQRARLPQPLFRELLVAGELHHHRWAAEDGAAGGALAACAPGSIVLECEGAGGSRHAGTAFKAPSGAIKPMVSKSENGLLLRRLGASAAGWSPDADGGQARDP
jgi:hypothetical protein